MGAVPSPAPVRYLTGAHAAEIRRPRVVRESPGFLAPKPKLLDRVRDAIRARHYSRRTEKAYVHWIRRYVFFHGKRHPADMGAPEVSAFLTALAVEHRVSASTQNQALSALLFLYRAVLGVDLPWLDEVVRAKRPQPLPVVLTRQKVYAVLRELSGRAGSWLSCSTGPASACSSAAACA